MLSDISKQTSGMLIMLAYLVDQNKWSLKRGSVSKGVFDLLRIVIDQTLFTAVVPVSWKYHYVNLSQRNGDGDLNNCFSIIIQEQYHL